MDREQCCRLCMSTNTEEHLNIFSDIGTKMKLSEIISEHFECAVSELDPLPNFVCQACWKTTDNFHELYQKSKTVQESFLKSSIKVEPNESELWHSHQETIFIEEPQFVIGPIKLETNQDESNSSDTDAGDYSDHTNDSDEIIEEKNDKETKEKSPTSKWDSISSNKKKGIKMRDREHVQYDKLFAEHKHQFNMNCESCPMTFKTLEEARKHYAKKHQNPNGYIKCCSFRLKYPYQVVRHLRKHQRRSRNKKQCRLCFKLLGSNYALKKHMNLHEERNETSDEEFMKFLKENFDLNCDQCDTMFSSFNHAQQHYKESHGNDNGYFKCKSCKIKVKQFSMLKHHVESHSIKAPETFKCDMCPKVFTTKRAISLHQRAHRLTMNKSFICHYCEKPCRDKFAITRHIFNIHMEDLERKFACDICDKKFHILELLERHIYAAHREKKREHTCEICGKSFDVKGNFDKHMLLHEDKSERLAQRKQCKHCGEWLSRSGIYYHGIIHNSAVQKCDQCHAEFPHKFALMAHIRKYHREPKHRCRYCDKTFEIGSKLREHEDTHTRQNIYPCFVANCSKTFTVLSSRKTHMRRSHPEEQKERNKMRKMLQLTPS
ncbi:zinc finger protein 287-like isoform X1 [Sitodiplosis mosellana]|uniref:zinc finger protein 287-like isoform X1 n=1 Tax=Sitodiplosis mosellana TaxID=263140 RepID=UPI0024446D2E|nr:zinc finger protein 287-like isoform X1 [Sitodiplosis mosellana]